MSRLLAREAVPSHHRSIALLLHTRETRKLWRRVMVEALQNLVLLARRGGLACNQCNPECLVLACLVCTERCPPACFLVLYKSYETNPMPRFIITHPSSIGAVLLTIYTHIELYYNNRQSSTIDVILLLIRCRSE